MTASAGAPLGVEDARRLLDEARAVVEAVDAMVEQAADPDDRTWAAKVADSVHGRWADLLGVVARGDADTFDRILDAVAAVYVPLQDAPPALVPAAEIATAQTNALAGDLHATYRPVLEPDRSVPAPVLARLSAALRTLAPEYRA